MAAGDERLPSARALGPAAAETSRELDGVVHGYCAEPRIGHRLPVYVPRQNVAAFWPESASTRPEQSALNQDRAAIYNHHLPSAESFLHQKQIGLRYVMSLADSANRETLPHAFE